MKAKVINGLIVFVLAVALSGCCGGGGKEAVVVAPEGGATTGKQLQDLKEAHDQGAITDKEYDKAKEKVLKAQ